MITLFLRFDLAAVMKLLRDTEVVYLNNHHIAVKVNMADIDGLTLYQAMSNKDSHIVYPSENKIAIGISLSQLTYTELLSINTSIINLRLDGLKSGETAYRTSNPHLFHIKGSKDGDYYVIRKVPHELPMAPVEYSEKLNEMLLDHDWYYGYSDSSAVYNRGEKQRAEIIDQMVAEGVRNPQAAYQDYAPRVRY